MRTLLLCVCLVIYGFNTQSQIVFEDNFDAYNTGEYLGPQSDQWTTWTESEGGSVDCLVSSEYFHSDSNAIELIGGGTQDVVLNFTDEPLLEGRYEIEFKMLIPTGEGGYFNVMHFWSPTNPNANEWATQVYFSDGGFINWTAGGTAGGGDVPFEHDTWMNIRVTADMDNDIGRLFLNNNVIEEWQWSLDDGSGFLGFNQLHVVNFYAWAPVGSGDGNYFIDDVVITESTGSYIAPSQELSFVVFPNPATDILNIALNSGETSNISIYDISGRKIKERNNLFNGNISFNVEDFPSGLYVVQVTNQSQTISKRIIKQ